MEFRKVDETSFALYDQIPMVFRGNSILQVERLEGGLGGLILREVSVVPFVKNLGIYERATELPRLFNLANWAFFMAFDGELPVGGVMVAAETPGLHMLAGRTNMSVLWDIRVDPRYANQGVGSQLFTLAVEWSKERGYVQMKIECQNNNVKACRFYHKHGAVLGAIDAYAYYSEPEVRNEVQLIWYLDFTKA